MDHLQEILKEPLPLFVIQAVVIITISRLIGLSARKISQPLVIAEVVAGILLGPSLLGLILPGVKAALFPQESMPLLYMFSQIGLIFFMFLVGLELDPRLLKGRTHTSVAISHSSIIAPFILGALLALYLHPHVSDPSVPFSSFWLFMGAAMSITAFPVLARILTERRMMNTRIGAITIACAAVDDVTAWCILAFVVSIVRATGITAAIHTTLLAIVYILVMVFLVKPFLVRLGARGVSRENMTPNLVAVTFLLLLLSSLTTEYIGIHALFGAFMFGAIMPREGGYAHALAEKLEDFVVIFLLPMFFAYSGLRTEIGLLNSVESWVFCGLIIAVACAGKFGGSAAAAHFTGLPWRESCAIGILMNTRGLMELIVLNIGYDLGVISPVLFTMMVIMALVTTFITTPLLHFIYPERMMERALAEVPIPAAVGRSPDRFGVLMCVANDKIGPPMATLAAVLVDDSTRADGLFALRLTPPADRTSSLIKQSTPDISRTGSMGLIPLLQRSEQLGIQVHPISFVSSTPSEDICRVAESMHADLVLLGWHKPLLSQALLGGTVYQVMSQAPSDVGVLVDRGLTQVRRVLVPYYGTLHDRAAMKIARLMNMRAGVEVTILHVVHPNRSEDAPRIGVKEQVDTLFKAHDEQRGDVVLKVMESEDPADTAMQEAANGYDLVVIGVGTEWGLEQRQFGLNPEQIIKQCPTSLLVVRAKSAKM